MKNNADKLIKNSENLPRQTFKFSGRRFSNIALANASSADKALSAERTRRLLTAPDKNRFHDFFLPAALMATLHDVNANTSPDRGFGAHFSYKSVASAPAFFN